MRVEMFAVTRKLKRTGKDRKQSGGENLAATQKTSVVDSQKALEIEKVYELFDTATLGINSVQGCKSYGCTSLVNLKRLLVNRITH